MDCQHPIVKKPYKIQEKVGVEPESSVWQVQILLATVVSRWFFDVIGAVRVFINMKQSVRRVPRQAAIRAWSVMPMATTLETARSMSAIELVADDARITEAAGIFDRHFRAAASCAVQISQASCSPPGLRENLPERRCASVATALAWSNTMALEDVVPWSSASM